MTLVTCVPYNVDCVGSWYLVYPLSPALSLREREYVSSPLPEGGSMFPTLCLGQRVYETAEYTDILKP